MCKMYIYNEYCILWIMYIASNKHHDFEYILVCFEIVLHYYHNCILNPKLWSDSSQITDTKRV